MSVSQKKVHDGTTQKGVGDAYLLATLPYSLSSCRRPWHSVVYMAASPGGPRQCSSPRHHPVARARPGDEVAALDRQLCCSWSRPRLIPGHLLPHRCHCCRLLHDLLCPHRLLSRRLLSQWRAGARAAPPEPMEGSGAATPTQDRDGDESDRPSGYKGGVGIDNLDAGMKECRQWPRWKWESRGRCQRPGIEARVRRLDEAEGVTEVEKATVGCHAGWALHA
jgi:hypothetical protein